MSDTTETPATTPEILAGLVKSAEKIMESKESSKTEWELANGICVLARVLAFELAKIHTGYYSDIG